MAEDPKRIDLNISFPTDKHTLFFIMILILYLNDALEIESLTHFIRMLK